MIGIQNKMIVSFTGLVITAVLAVFLIFFEHANNEERKTLRSKLEGDIKAFEQSVQSKPLVIESALLQLARNKEIIQRISTLGETEISSLFGKIDHRIRADLFFSFSNKTLQESPINFKFSKETRHLLDGFSKQIAKQKKIEYVLWKNKIYQVVIVPVLNPRPIAWICAGILVNDAHLKSLTLSSDLKVIFLSKTGNTVTKQSDNLTGSEPESFSPILKTMLDSKKNDLSLPYIAEQKILTVTPEYRISVLYYIPIQHFQKAQLTLLYKTLVALLIAITFAVVLALFLSRKILSPLRIFTEISRKNARNNSFEPLIIPNEIEFAELAREFNQMQLAIIRRENEIQYRAFYDTLTNLPNRALFHEQLESMLSKAREKKEAVAVLMMDLNRFKDINDTLGHQSGDKLLKQVARRLSTHFSAPEYIVSRLGGDEFALMLPDATTEKITQFSESILQLFNKPFTLEGLKLDISASIGVSLFPQDADDASSMLQKADVAMYIAKEQKKGFCFYEQSLDKHSVLRLNLMTELKAAVKRNELVLYYQPKVDLKDNSIDQVEALVRWIHPKHGLVSPTQFIPLAEQTGYVRDLTRWALFTAAKQCYEWQLVNIPIKIAVNISAIDLLDVKLEDEIKALFQAIPIPTHRIVLEVTESAIMINPLHAIQTLKRLSEFGIRLSLDDFGTGHSSMAQLKMLPVQEIKIDQSFITNMIQDKNDETMVKTMIELGHNLGMDVVAEGVDDISILSALKKFSCNKVQGHYISPPLSITEFSQWLIKSSYRLKNLGK